jgi:hypothetical protein
MTDTLVGERVLGGALEVYSADSLRVLHTTRSLMEEGVPCAALRIMAETKGATGLGAVTDTATAGCDELRVSTDTEVVGYQHRGQGLEIPTGRARIRGDTIIIEEEYRHTTVDEPTRSWTRPLVYLRVAPAAASPQPQN